MVLSRGGLLVLMMLVVAVKEISAEVIEDLFRTLWNRSSTWKGGVTR